MTMRRRSRALGVTAMSGNETKRRRLCIRLTDGEDDDLANAAEAYDITESDPADVLEALVAVHADMSYGRGSLDYLREDVL